MRNFPSCFGENGVQVSDASSSGSSKSCQNVVTSLYQAHLRRRPCVITVTWTRHLMGQGLAVGIDDSCSRSLCKVDIKPWLFTKTKGSKSLDAEAGGKVDIFWDLSAAKFGSGPEPTEGFYVAVLFDLDMVLLLGDLTKEAYKKTNAVPSPSNAVLIAKKEHLFGKNVYSTKAQLCDSGKVHDVAIECETVGCGGGGGGLKEPSLEIRIDRRRVLQVKRLGWKFRGNQTILVDGTSVEVFWDVHSWLFGGHIGNAVFMFQSCLPTEKLLPRSCSQSFKETQLQGLGFSLVLYAWKNE